MSEQTPFVVNRSGRIHLASCHQKGGPCLPVSSDVIAKAFGVDAADGYFTASTGCCFANPGEWLAEWAPIQQEQT